MPLCVRLYVCVHALTQCGVRQKTRGRMDGQTTTHGSLSPHPSLLERCTEAHRQPSHALALAAYAAQAEPRGPVASTPGRVQVWYETGIYAADT